MEKVKKVVGYAAVSIIGLGFAYSASTTSVEAYIRREDLLGTSNYDIVDVASWDQMGYYGKAPTVDGMGGFHWSEGCMTMSYATFMRKTGQKDKTFGPAQAWQDLNQAGYYGNGGQFPLNAYNAGVKWGDWTMEGFVSGGYQAMKSAWEEGYGVICFVSMGNGGYHVFTIDSIDGDTVMHLDTGRGGNNLDESEQWGKGAIVGFYKLKSPDGSKFKDLPRLNDVRDGSNGKASKKEENKGKETTPTEGDGSLPAEDELVGMTKRNHKLYEYQLPIIFPGQEISGESGLSQEQEANVASLGEDVSSKRFNLIEILRVAVAFSGITAAVYGVFLLVSYLLDRSNSFFEVSFLGLLTFGSYGYRHDGMPEKEGKTKLINTAGIIKLVIFVEIVAWVLYSGYSYIIMKAVYDFVSGIVTSWF